MRGEILLKGIVGSTAYGFAGPDSDVDTLGMFALPTEELFLLGNPTESIVRTDPDSTLHEARKWCRLALKCNPTVMELVWLPDELYEIRHDFGDQLIEIRSAFLSRQAVRDSYLGYATQQLNKLKATQAKMDNPETPESVRRRRAKHARHLVRLVHQGTLLHETGYLEIQPSDPQTIVNLGEHVVEDPEYGNFLIMGAESIFERRGKLPDEPDPATVEEWLVAVRRHYL